jgi:hypothetical protein
MCSRTSERRGAGGPQWGLPAAAMFLGLSVFPGCLSIDAPPGFLVIEKGSSSLKALTADEARLWVREFSDSTQGDLAFWSEAVRNDFAANRGYTLIEERPVKDAAGREGKESVFEITAGGQALRYLATLFVREGWFANRIRVAEFAAPREVFAKHAAAVRQAIGTIRRVPF